MRGAAPGRTLCGEIECDWRWRSDSDRHKPFELLEAVPPTVLVKLAARFCLERALSEGDFRHRTKTPKRQLDDSLDVIRIRVLILERVSQAARRINLAKLAGQ